MARLAFGAELKNPLGKNAGCGVWAELPSPPRINHESITNQSRIDPDTYIHKYQILYTCCTWQRLLAGVVVGPVQIEDSHDVVLCELPHAASHRATHS